MSLRFRLSAFDGIKEDVQTAFRRDPAARSFLEVILCYPGLHAIWFHRVAHWLWTRGHRLMARFLSHVSRFLTGVEIHPGARIGRRLFIDHGMGVVIGETAEIGDDCLLYQGVVLGGTSRDKGKRHPTLRDRVVVGAGAVVLGPVLLGRGSRVGAGSVVIRSVPPDSTVVGVPARVVGDGTVPAEELQHGLLPDPVAAAIQGLHSEVQALRERIRSLEEKNAVAVDREAELGPGEGMGRTPRASTGLT
jgi:serine O-acetyltransferase